MPTTRLDFDIAICGAGPVGCVLALLLHQQRPQRRIALFGQPPPAQGAALDPRTLALNYGSYQLLQQLGVWPEQHAPMTTVHVSQQGRLGRTLITPNELGVHTLGSVVNYDQLLQGLRQTILQRNIQYIELDQPAHARYCPQRQAAVISGSGRDYYATLAVQSDGSRATQLERKYNQHALLATVQSSQPKKAWAFERFTSHGPLALLPHPSQADCYAVVWCNTPSRSHYLEQLEPQKFENELQQAFGARLGALRLVSPRYGFELRLSAGTSLPSPRVVALGNAAQTLHPVAGQGLNLGLRDVGQLVLSLRSWLADPSQAVQAQLEHYAAQRRADRWLTGGITDTLPRLFISQNPLIEHACGLGLLGMDMLAMARKPLARQLLQGLRV